MGSFFSPPKPSTPPSVIYIPAPAPESPHPPPASPAPSAPPPAITPVTGEAPPADPIDDQEKSDIRARNLLNQHRGRLGTIVTSAKGILTDPANLSGRKNLLGE